MHLILDLNVLLVLQINVKCITLGVFQKDTIKAVDFTFERFLAFYNRLVTRTDMDTVFVDL